MDTTKIINNTQGTKINLYLLGSFFWLVVFANWLFSFYETYYSYYSNSDSYIDRNFKQSATEYCTITEESFPEDDCETKSFDALLSDFKNQKKTFSIIELSMIFLWLAISISTAYVAIALSKK